MSEPAANPVAIVRHQVGIMQPEFAAALPSQIPVERFTRVFMTAIQNNPDLLRVERRSLLNAAMRAAQDGLLPDGREGALVVFKDRNRGPIAQWMPMVAGLRKKVRNSGEIATWEQHVVYANDHFEYELGDFPFIKHKPALSNPGPVIAAYSVAVLKTGERSREVMPVAEIEKVREASRSRDRGPWVDWYEEMCRKTVARRHAKVLPMSTDIDEILRRDDELYQGGGGKEEAPRAAQPVSLAGKLDNLAKLPEPEAEAPANPWPPSGRDDDDGADPYAPLPQETPPEAPQMPQDATSAEPAPEAMEIRETLAEARQGGAHDARRGLRRIPPTKLAPEQKTAWLEGYDAEKAGANSV